MKVLRLSAALLLLGSLSVSLASDTVDDYISAIQDASTSQERVELINEFKTILPTLSDEDKISAIEQLREIAKADGMMTQTQTQARVQTRQREMMNTVSEGMMSAQGTATSNIQSATSSVAMAQNSMSKAFRGGR